MKKGILSLFVGLLIVISGTHTATAGDMTKVMRFKGRVTASQVSTTIDVNMDGLPANLTTGIGHSNHGRIVGRSVSEGQPSLVDLDDPLSIISCQMPNGDPGLQFDLVSFNGVLRIEDLNDAVFLKQDSGTVCNDLRACFGPDTGALQEGCIFRGDFQLTIAGGTGRLKDASGLLTFVGDGEILLVDPTGNFSGVSGVFEGDINIPR